MRNKRLFICFCDSVFRLLISFVGVHLICLRDLLVTFSMHTLHVRLYVALLAELGYDVIGMQIKYNIESCLS